jgi:hypothetical protein
MRAIVQEICLNSYETTLNIWDVNCTFRKRGDLAKIGADRRPASILSKKDGLKFSTMMANYFSTGEESKIGFDFEAKRTASKCGNICRYACAGIKLLCCRCCCWKASENIPLKQQLKYTKITKSPDMQDDLMEMNDIEKGKPKNRASFTLQFNQQQVKSTESTQLITTELVT